MRIWITLLIIGSIISGLGIIFHFQGKTWIGPESSFMYSNPEWITYGLEILVFGIVFAVSGIFFRFRDAKKSRN